MKRILLCPDVENWCWWHQSLALQKYAPPEYGVEVVPQQVIQNKKEDTAWLKSFDSILHWSWVDCPFLFGIRRLVTVVAHDGLKWHFVTDESKQIWNTEWRQFAAASPQRNYGNARKTLPRVDHVICVNPDLQAFVQEKIRQRGSSYLPVGVDHNLYVPKTTVFDETKLKVGWCGQDGAKTKGIPWILNPLMERLGNKVEFILNIRNHSDPLSPEEMCEWYNSIDVFLCTSISEGTPAPPLEAMSCGRGVITTPVGDMPNVLDGTGAGKLVSGYANDDQSRLTISEMEECLLSLTPAQARSMGEAARQRIEEQYTWEKLSPKWLETIAG